jgi:hypothetical protein
MRKMMRVEEKVAKFESELLGFQNQRTTCRRPIEEKWRQGDSPTSAQQPLALSCHHE